MLLTAASSCAALAAAALGVALQAALAVEGSEGEASPDEVEAQRAELLDSLAEAVAELRDSEDLISLLRLARRLRH